MSSHVFVHNNFIHHVTYDVILNFRETKRKLMLWSLMNNRVHSHVLSSKFSHNEQKLTKRSLTISPKQNLWLQFSKSRKICSLDLTIQNMFESQSLGVHVREVKILGKPLQFLVKQKMQTFLVRQTSQNKISCTEETRTIKTFQCQSLRIAKCFCISPTDKSFQK